MSHKFATHCEALNACDISFVEIMRAKSPHTVRVIHGRVCAMIRDRQSPAEGCCQASKIGNCRTCDGMAQLLNLLAYDNYEWCTWLAIHSRELIKQGIDKMTCFQKDRNNEINNGVEWLRIPYWKSPDL